MARRVMRSLRRSGNGHRSAGPRGAGSPSVVGFATQGAGSRDEDRVAELLASVGGELWSLERTSRGGFARALVRRLRADRPPLVVMEGTGLGGGLPLIYARYRFGTRFVVSSGDAVAPFFGLTRAWLRPVGWCYERTLMRAAAGFVGWTPYLVGRALTLGCPRGVTVPGWPPAEASRATTHDPGRSGVRDRLGLAHDDVVFGMVGSLVWNPRVGYCYGLELVEAVRRCDRPDVKVVVVGDGDGRAELERRAGGDPRIVFTGRVPRDDVPELLAAFDVASLAQSVDDVGAFRYTTKLPEYVDAGVSIVTTPIPAAFDLAGPRWVVIDGDSPWDPTFIDGLAAFMSTAVRAPSAGAPSGEDPTFDRRVQLERFGRFVTSLLGSPPLGRDVADTDNAGRSGSVVGGR